MQTLVRALVLLGAGLVAAPHAVAHEGHQGHPGYTAESGERRTPSVAVRQAQRQLNRMGYRAGPEDGRAGPQTRRAVRTFQRDEELRASGELDRATLAALGVETGRATAGAGAETSGAGRGARPEAAPAEPR
jgi:hypothetical protein